MAQQWLHPLIKQAQFLFGARVWPRICSACLRWPKNRVHLKNICSVFPTLPLHVRQFKDTTKLYLQVMVYSNNWLLLVHTLYKRALVELSYVGVGKSMPYPILADLCFIFYDFLRWKRYFRFSTSLSRGIIQTIAHSGSWDYYAIPLFWL